MCLDTKLDEMYNEFDNLFLNDKFNEANQKLQEINISNTSTDLLIGYLSITLHASKKLPYRNEFSKKVEIEIKKRPGYVSGMLQGLIN